MNENDRHQIRDDGLAVTVAAMGGEMQSVRTPGGRELLWQAGPQWPRHAPVLFPVVGRLAEDTLGHESARYRMAPHGFARDRAFRFIDRDPHSCRLLLEDDAQSRAIFPFSFRLEIQYRAIGATLTV